ncbi:histidinol dehydrogenase, partial [candidate division FCPU426 bacterium]|nr:histidinol dehydrogenase [candidate division FCPU426 bacterium]
RQGEILPALLYAAELAGVDVVYRLGGAAAVGAMAYGTRTIPAVDKIVGPANVFGTEAKRQVVGRVGIDSLAGPSEIVIVAQEDAAKAEWVAWDLLAQGEHGSGAVAVLLSPSAHFLAQVARAGRDIVRKHPELSAAQKAMVLFKVRDLRAAMAMADAYAPEHLSLQLKDPHRWLEKVSCAGAVFIGTWTAQAMGDYTAGPNHVLPTHGTARWASPLSVRDFERYTSIVEYTASGIRREGPAAVTVAATEGLLAHANSIQQRISRK